MNRRENSLAPDQKEIQHLVQNDIKEKIHRILKWGGFRNSFKIMIALFASFDVINMIIDAVFMAGSWCLMYNLCILFLQIESLVLYAFAWWCVHDEFIISVVESLCDIDTKSALFLSIIQDHTNNTASSLQNENININNPRPISINVLSIQRRGNKHNNIDDDQNDNEQQLLRSMASQLSIEEEDMEFTQLSKDIYQDYKTQNGNQITCMQMLKWEILKCAIIMAPGYISGLFVNFSNGYTANNAWDMYEIIGGILDVIRYLPQVLHVALVSSYFATFVIRLDHLRQETGVLTRMNKLKTMDIVKKRYILDINHQKFILFCSQLFRGFRILSHGLSGWIFVYLILNFITWIFFALTTVSSLVHGRCYKTASPWYSVHYVIEMISFFSLWIYLVWPLCFNHQLLTNFVNDVKAMANADSMEKCSIDQYVSSLVDASPFSIFYIKPNYSKLLIIVYLVCVIVLIDFLVKADDWTF